MRLAQNYIMAIVCKVFFCSLYIYLLHGESIEWGILVLIIGLCQKKQSTSPPQGINGLLINHNSFKN